MIWIVGFLLLHVVALTIMHVRKTDNIFGAYCAAFLVLFFGGGAVVKAIEYVTGVTLIN